MLKIIFALTMISGAASLFADEMDYNNTVTGTYSESREERPLARNHVRAGLLTGVNSPNDANATIAYGVTATMQPYEHLAVGLDADTSRMDDGSNAQRSTALVNALYVLGGDVPVLRTVYAGVGAGFVVLPSKFRLGYAPTVGFDVPFDNTKNHDFLSLGLTAKYLVNPDIPNALGVAASLKYWF
jgi:hypothetical protein